MLKKSYSKTRNYCRVTFKLPADLNAQAAVLCGDFNQWDPKAMPMNRLKDGSFSMTLSLPANQHYRFRYLLDGSRWENDGEADAYLPNAYGSDDSIVRL